MDEEFIKIKNTVNDLKNTVQIRKENFLKFEIDEPPLFEFIELVLNDCNKLIQEVNQIAEATSGIKGVFSGKKKKIKMLADKLEKCNNNVIENESKILNFYLNFIIDLEEKYRNVLNEFALLREEMRKKEIIWQSVSDAMNKLIVIRDSFDPLKDKIFSLKDSRKINTSPFLEVTDILLELKNGLTQLQNENLTLEKKVGFRNIVLAKINTAISKNEDIAGELSKKLDLNLIEFFDKLFEETISESTSDSYLEEIMPLLDSIGDSATNLSELIISYEEAGLPLSIVIEQPDIKGALNLLKIIINQFKNEYKDYIDQESKFTEKLKEISLETAPILISIKDYLERLPEDYGLFKKFIMGIITSWFLKSKEKGGWKIIKKQYLTLENFLLNHYPSIEACLDLRLKGINHNTIKGISMFQDCIPTEYKNETFILNTVLPGILYVYGVDILNNSLTSYGERGWIKRGEIQLVSDEYIENYLALNPNIKNIKIDSFEIIVSPEIILKKINTVTKESLFDYFNKYITDKKLCEEISIEINKIINY